MDGPCAATLRGRRRGDKPTLRSEKLVAVRKFVTRNGPCVPPRQEISVRKCLTGFTPSTTFTTHGREANPSASQRLLCGLISPLGPPRQLGLSGAPERPGSSATSRGNTSFRADLMVSNHLGISGCQRRPSCPAEKPSKVREGGGAAPRLSPEGCCPCSTKGCASSSSDADASDGTPSS
eukprot:scaffold122754_cov68-Phaeocystis_antarctica.AAC.3